MILLLLTITAIELLNNILEFIKNDFNQTTYLTLNL